MTTIQSTPTSHIKYTLTALSNETYVIRPSNALGTCGSCNGVLWTAVYVKGLHKACRIADAMNHDPKYQPTGYSI